MTARRFELHRDVDIQGTTGIGVVAEGCAFTDGTSALRWTTPRRRYSAVYDTLTELDADCGHGGSTRIVWLDTDQPLRKVADDPQHPSWPQR